jgi:hypothetical protein
MMALQACRVLIGMFKPGLGNGFPTVQYVHYKAHVLSLCYCTLVIRCISKDHDGYCAINHRTSDRGCG